MAATSRSDTADGSVESCPRCMSPFDNRVHKVVMCPECSQECATACCMPQGEDGWCPECDEAS